MNRRIFIKRSAMAGLALSAAPAITDINPFNQEFPVYQVTDGEKQHWFGYYDKWQVDTSGRYALGNQVELFYRSPTPDDILRIGLIDLENDFQWKEIGQSSAWGWQQGCMLQWIPGSSEEVIWNDRQGDDFVSKIYNINSGKTRLLSRPIYTLSPDGKFGLSVNFARLQEMRPGYGYVVPGGVGELAKSPEDDGIFKVDLKTGESQLIISLDRLAQLKRELGSVKDNYHWVNHLLISPGGNRFIFLNRSRPFQSEAAMKGNQNPGFSGKYLTRAITANTDGSEIYPLNDSGGFSHFIWKGDDVIAAWARPEDSDINAFYRFFDKSKKYEIINPREMPLNGHNTYIPNTNYEWILNDTYPLGPNRLQELYLYHVPTKRRVDLGKFHEPQRFNGEWRCDLHPRSDQQGKRVFFDSTHSGKRQMYMINIDQVVKTS